MRAWLLSLTAAAGLGGLAFGQTPQAGYGPATYPSSGGGVTFAPVPPGGFMPNIYDRSTQPLSPYLNLFRGQSPAVDYFYGVRPGLRSGQGFGNTGMTGGGYGGSRAGYLPLQAATAEQGVAIPEAGLPLPNNQLYQTGHPVGFSTGPGRTGSGYAAGRPGFTRSQTAPPARRGRR